jgi:hypothetical protein
MRWRDITRVFLWNAGMVAAVFLPIFLVLARLQSLFLVGESRSFLSDVLEGLYLYLLFLFPLILASVIYTAILFIVPPRWTMIQRRSVAILLAFILPVIVYGLNLPGGLLYIPFYVPTLFATVTYGLFTRVGTQEKR